MNEDLKTALEKEAALKSMLKAYGGLALAYSGGVDSTYLADVAHEVLRDRLRLLTADSPSMPRTEFEEAKAIAQERGWPLEIIKTREFENQEFLKNDKNRCYICKGELFAQMKKYAAENAITTLAYGETADDINDVTRVGRNAAKENGAVAPLLDAALKKEEVRLLSRRRGLPTWNKPSFACLSSRFPTGRPLTLDEMAQVERAEQVLKKNGFRQYRARHHGEICRIEIDLHEIHIITNANARNSIVHELKKAGYRHVTLDLTGYKTGGAT